MSDNIENKTIAYISVVHPLHDHRFLYKQCSGLVEHGFEVDYYVQHTQTETIQGVNIKPLKKYKSRPCRFLSTFLLLPKLLKKKYAAYHLVDPELLPLGIILKIFTKKIVVFDAHEDYVDFMKHKHYLKSSVGKLFSFLIKRLLDLSSRMLDGFVFADEGTANLFDKLPENRKQFFYNYPLRSMFPEQPKQWNERKYDIVFLGTMSKTSGIFVILNALKVVKRAIPQFKLLLIGQPGPEVDDAVHDFITKNDLKDDVEITGRIPHSCVPGLLQECKIGLITLVDIPKFHKNIATKLFEYMASGIPVISSDLPPERKFIEPGNCGDFFPPENHEILAQKIENILLTPELGAKMSKYCRNYMVANNLFAENEIKKLTEFYKFMLANYRELI